MPNNFQFTIEVDLPEGANDAITKAAALAFKEVSAELHGRFMDAMSQDVWVWPRQSKRGVGGSSLSDVARKYKKKKFNTGSPRSIVDSGELKGSVNFSPGYRQANWAWTTSYAAAVHDGAWIQPWGNDKAEKVLLPARPWTEAVLFGHPHYSGEVYPFSDRLAKSIERRLR